MSREIALANGRKPRPEDALANAETNFEDRFGFPLPMLENMIQPPDMRYSVYHSRSAIEDSLAVNRNRLANLPDAAMVEELAALAAAMSKFTPAVAKREVGLLVGAYPNASPGNTEVYIGAMVFDLLDLRIPDAVVVLAMRELRRTHKFVPSIAEVLTMADTIKQRWNFIGKLPGKVALAREDLEEAIRGCEQALAELDKPRPVKALPAPTSAQRSGAQHYPILEREFADDPSILAAFALLDANGQAMASAALAKSGRAAAEAIIRSTITPPPDPLPFAQ